MGFDLLVAAVMALQGCYLSHELGGASPPGDSGVDSRPSPDSTRPRPDSRPPPTDAPPPPDVVVVPPPPECERGPWARIDLGSFPGTRIGPVAASETTIAWVGQNLAGATLTRLDRRSLDFALSPIDPAYVQDAAILWTGEVFVVAYEHTGPRGMNEGVYVTVAEDGIGGFIEPPIALSATGGDPSIAHLHPDRVLIAWSDGGVVVNEYSTVIREPRSMNRTLGGSAVGVVGATSSEYVIGIGRAIERLDFDAIALAPFAPTRGVVRRMAVNDRAVAVELVGGTIESFTFSGAPIAIDRPEEVYDIPIAGFREWFFGINPTIGESKVTSSELVIEFLPGDFPADLASVSHTPTGFVALTASLPVGNDPLVTLIERCDAL